MTASHPEGDLHETESEGADTAIDRRSFVKSALVVGGGTALSSLTSVFGDAGVASAGGASVGVPDRLNRQHAWDAFEAEARGTTVPPKYHLFLHLDLADEALDDGTVTADARQQVGAALDAIEDNYEWGPSGVFFTIGYSPAYFDRFEEDLPGELSSRDTSTGLIDPAVTVQATAAPHEDPADIAADDYDAVLHMASDDPRNLLAIEYALWEAADENEDIDQQGSEDTDVSVPDLGEGFSGVFDRPTEYPARRVAFAGHEVVEEELSEALAGTDQEGIEAEIPDQNGTTMGFNPLRKNSVPREDLASMTEDQKLVDPADPGVFAQGTIEHVSHMETKLDLWYGAETGEKPENTHDERRKQMFSPEHTEENTGTVGEKLGKDTGVDGTAMRESGSDTDLAEMTVEHAREEGIVGHSQKTARSRFDIEARETGDAGAEPADDFEGHEGDQTLEQPVLRRDVPTADTGHTGVHFVGLMRFNGYFHYCRQAMNGTAFDTSAFGLTGEDRIQHPDLREHLDEDDENGIVPYLLTQRRGNYLVPPIAVRALPPARAERPAMTVNGDDTINPEGSGTVFVVLDMESVDVEADDVDQDTVRFGATDVVNRGGGAVPRGAHGDDGSLACQFKNEATGFDDAAESAAGYDDDGDDDGTVTARFFAKTEDGYPIRATVECDVSSSRGGGRGRGDRGRDDDRDRGRDDDRDRGEGRRRDEEHEGDDGN